MIRSLDTLNRNMNVLQKKQENASTNLANTNTPGYKYQQVLQSTLESQDLVNYTGGNGTQRHELGLWTMGNQVDAYITEYGSGSILETEDPLDFAIPGPGFFVLDLGNGQRGFTRNGNFTLNEENQLVTMEGYLVMGESDEGTEMPIVFDQRGDIVNGARFLGMNFAQMETLTRMGETIFLDPENLAEEVVLEPVKGFLEMSNVVLADEMVRLIQIAREFEANQKLLQTSEDTLNKAVNEVGKV